MSSSDIWKLFLLGFLLLFSGFFSASETALMALSKFKVRHMMENGVKGAKIVFKLIEWPEKLLSTILLGNNVVNIGASALATSLAITYFGEPGVGIATVIMTILVLIFAEITPKSIAAQNPVKVALGASKLIYPLTIILGPLVKILSDVTNSIIKMMGGKNRSENPLFTPEEFQTLVNVGVEEGILEKQEQEIIQNVFEFKNSVAGQIMIPRTEIYAIDIGATYDEIMNLFKTYHFSRMPVYEESKDNILGILNLKDFLLWTGDLENFNIRELMKDPFYSYEFTSTAKLFAQMKNKKVRMAIILGEYGGTAGIATLADMISEIIGEIEDDDREADKKVVQVQENEYIVDGSTRLEKLEDYISFDFDAVSEEFDSISGFVMWHLKGVPHIGAVVEQENLTLVVEDVEKNRIKKIRIFVN